MLALFIAAAVVSLETERQPEYVDERVAELYKIASEKYPQLVLDDGLNRESQKWAEHLARTGRFYHDRGVRENIARGYRTSKAAMQGWIRSRGHERQFRKNKFVGFGVARTANGNWYWVSRFKNREGKR